MTVADDKRDCANPDCTNEISVNMHARFCFTCLSMLQKQEQELADELSHVLRLEAEFVQWCDEHNYPHPHED